MKMHDFPELTILNVLRAACCIVQRIFQEHSHAGKDIFTEVQKQGEITEKWKQTFLATIATWRFKQHIQEVAELKKLP